MIKKIKVYLIFSLFLAILSCTTGKKPENKVPVAKVYDKYLYLSDIAHIFKNKVTKQDSIEIATSYINTWIKTQLLLRQSELNLTPEQLDISQQLDAYRSSLLIYKYEEQMVEQKIDTSVTDKEVEDYYSRNTTNFILEENLVKALYLKIPRSAPDIDGLKKWYKSENKEDLKKLDSYCYNYAAKYDFFNNQWVSFTLLKRDLPEKIEDEDEFLKTNQFIEQKDTSSYYFVYIKEISHKGTLSPLVFVKSQIIDIILNKRKVKFLGDLETNIFNDAQDHKHFVIYNLDKN